MGDKKDRLTGKVKQAVGKAKDDPGMEAAGRRHEVKGNVKAGGKKLKDAGKKL